MAGKKKKPKTNIAAGRPPTLQRHRAAMSRKATKALINKHHVLEKRKQQALSKGDETAVAEIEAEIEAGGGLERYQKASLQGQSHDRGGDSSRVLMKWLEPCASCVSSSLRVRSAEKSAVPASAPASAPAPVPAPGGSLRLRMLEVGALSASNACSQSGAFDVVERIDLNSQGDDILQQDFMARPLPRDESEKFDIISLSLVLNFVPDPHARGQMLLRTLQFLHEPGRYAGHGHYSSSLETFFPSLFLVLPAPCVTNSRYLDEERLLAIMTSLGYVKAASKTTQRLVYYLWRRDAGVTLAHVPFPKKEIRSGPARNNFAIVLK